MFCPASREIRADLKRRGMSMMEAIIMIVVCMVALWAVMSAVAASTGLHTSARSGLNARMFAMGWFEVFESVEPDSGFTMKKAADFVADTLDRNNSSNFPDYKILGYTVKVQGNENSATPYGVRRVSLEITPPGAGDELQRKSRFTLERQINARSSALVSDDRYH